MVIVAVRTIDRLLSSNSDTTHTSLKRTKSSYAWYSFFCSRSFSTHFLFHFSHFVFNFELTNRRRCLGSSTMTPARLRSVAEYLPKLNQSLSTIFLSLDQSLGNYLHTQPKSLNGIWTTQPLHTTVILIIA